MIDIRNYEIYSKKRFQAFDDFTFSIFWHIHTISDANYLVANFPFCHTEIVPQLGRTG